MAEVRAEYNTVTRRAVSYLFHTRFTVISGLDWVYRRNRRRTYGGHVFGTVFYAQLSRRSIAASYVSYPFS